MRLGRVLVALVPLLGVVASSCSTTESNGLPQTGPGYVTGVAAPCGLGLPDRPVQVRLSQDSSVVAVKTVTGSHRFMFSAPAGRYVLSSNQAEVKPVRVQLVHSLEAIVDLPSTCK